MKRSFKEGTRTRRKPTAVTSINNIQEVRALEERRSRRENWDEERKIANDAGKELRT